ncbi:helix-turn-helix domain-containing protein [Enterococcus sp. C60(2024)]
MDSDRIILETTKIASLEFYEKTLLESTTIRLLLTILDCKTYTISSLRSILFISESTLKRQVIHLNNFFRHKSIDIIIKTAPNIQIYGNERLIRAFYQQLLLEVYSELIKTNNKFVNLLTHLERFMEYNIPQYKKFTTLEHVGIYLYISLTRNIHISIEKRTEINRFQTYLINAIRQDTVFQQFLLREFKFDASPTSIQSIIITDLTSVLWNEQQASLPVLDIN